jgi:uncharacterized SAM-dependent methyltransferase
MQLNLNNNPSGPSQQVIDDYTRFFNGEKNDDMLKYAYMGEDNNAYYDFISKCESYYPYKDEINLIKNNAQEIANSIGEGVDIYEIGPGSDIIFQQKIAPIISRLKNPRSYVAVDTCAEYAMQVASFAAQIFPKLNTGSVSSSILELNRNMFANGNKKLFIFLGGTLGNFTDENINKIFSVLSNCMNPDDRLLFSVDCNNNVDEILAAYQNPWAEKFFSMALHNSPMFFQRKFVNVEFEYAALWNKFTNSVEFNFFAKEKLLNHHNYITTKEHFYLGRSKRFKDDEILTFSSSNMFFLMDIFLLHARMSMFIFKKL